MLERLARCVVRRRQAVLAMTGLAFVAAAVFGAGVFGAVKTGGVRGSRGRVEPGRPPGRGAVRPG